MERKWAFQVCQESYNELEQFTGFPHDERVLALVVSNEDLWYDDENTSTALRRDAPRTLHVGWIQSRPVGTLDVALLSTRLSNTRSICKFTPGIINNLLTMSCGGTLSVLH